MNNKVQDARMKSLVEISTLVTESADFFAIKDKIIEKMLEVVHPTKACVNLFYKNNYEHAYLVCSETLDYISDVFPMDNQRGVKINFNTYPKYIREAVKEKKVIYIENVLNDERAKEEVELAEKEGYVGRIVFPLTMQNTVVGFMTCFLTKEDSINDEDIDFISSVASLLSLSIEITNKNSNVQMIINKLRASITSINEATKKLYLNKNINGFLEHLSKQACNITNSKEALIVINDNENKNKLFNYYNSEQKQKINTYTIVNDILSKPMIGGYCNTREDIIKEKVDIESYIYYKLKDKDKILGCIICANSKNYTDDDLSVLSILANQILVGMQLYEYNREEVRHRVLANELNVLNKQQRLIMDESNIDFNEEKELFFYHKPARVVGGDFYYALKLNENKIAYIIADVMGHGIISNYVVALIKGTFKALCRQYKSPGEILTNLNDILYDEFDKMGVFTTCLVSILDSREETITVSNAGHYSPIMITKDGQVIKNLNCEKGIPLGVLENVEYKDNIKDISNCSMIAKYTDGLLEIKNKEKEEYGIERLEQFFVRNYNEDKDTIINNLKEELYSFSSKDIYEDDILVVMLKEK